MKLVHMFGAMATIIASAMLASVAFASGGGGETFKEGVNYIAIKPALVVNYGGPGRVKYIKAELSLRTEDAHSAQEVSHHMPLIRDTLIMLISSVTDEQMASGDGKEKMRLEALAKVNEALQKVNKPGDDHKADEPQKKTDDKLAKNHKPKQGDDKDLEKTKDSNDVKDTHEEQLVSDVLFDNLVVQK